MRSCDIKTWNLAVVTERGFAGNLGRLGRIFGSASVTGAFRV